MKRLYIIVEGQTEEEFVKTMILPYMQQFGIYEVIPILIRTSKEFDCFRSRFPKYIGEMSSI